MLVRSVGPVECFAPAGPYVRQVIRHIGKELAIVLRQLPHEIGSVRSTELVCEPRRLHS